VPGGSIYDSYAPGGGPGMGGTVPDEPWKAYVNPDGSIRSTPRGPWDV
jgi:hypothetical protein